MSVSTNDSGRIKIWFKCRTSAVSIYHCYNTRTVSFYENTYKFYELCRCGKVFNIRVCIELKYKFNFTETGQTPNKTKDCISLFFFCCKNGATKPQVCSAKSTFALTTRLARASPVMAAACPLIFYLPKVPKIKIQEYSQMSFYKILKNKWHHAKKKTAEEVSFECCAA